MQKYSKRKSNVTPTSTERFDIFLDEICREDRGVDPTVLRKVVELSLEISREGREGRKIGTMFVVGDENAVLKLSRNLILDPLKGHPTKIKHIDYANLQETVKELAQLDGAFIVSNSGIVLSAARYIEASSKNIELPLGLGSRHVAAASISQETNAVAVVVSESSVVRIVDEGKMIAEIIPELWLIQGTSLERCGENNIGIVDENKKTFSVSQKRKDG